MKKNLSLSLLSILLLILFSGCVKDVNTKAVNTEAESINMDKYVKASDLTLYKIYLQVVDFETNKPVNVLIDGPKPLIEPKMSEGILARCPVIMESLGKGITKIIWIDLKESKETVTLIANGYPKTRLPLNYRERIDSSQSSSGDEPPARFRLKKSNKME